MINSLLSSLPRSRGHSRFPGLERIDLAFGQVLHDPGKRFAHVYFPIDSLVSLVSGMKGETPIELAVIGCDGMVGMQLAMGGEASSARAVVQAPGAAMRATAGDFMTEFKRRPLMRRAVRRYSNDLTDQVMRTAACMRNHSAEQRLARWLLMMRDRLSTDRYRLTQEYLAYMLGTRRAAVNEAAGRLQRRGLIRYVRGSIEILDAAGLKAASCGCYRSWKESPQGR